MDKLERELDRLLKAVQQGRPMPETMITAFTIYQYFSRQNQLAPQKPGVSGIEKMIKDLMLIQLLNHHITKELNRLRNCFDLPTVEAQLNQRSALEEIRRDFRQDSAELEAWSLLYFLYVRVDLGLSPTQVAKEVSQVQRTIRRRVKRGVRSLAFDLLNAEVRSNQNQANGRGQNEF